MYALVDYDNLRPDQKRLALTELARRIADAVLAAAPTPPGTLDVRLYGGWYAVDAVRGTHRPTAAAQELMRSVGSSDFPFFYTPSGHPGRIRVLMSLARSMLVDPSRDLVRTYRPKPLYSLIGKPRSVKTVCQHDDKAQCCLRGLKKLFTKQVCPDCAAVSTDFLPPGGEQKLVDTMIAADLLQAAASGEGVALVSSDDDFVPPIWQGVVTGGTVYHIQTYPGRLLEAHYRPAAGLAYHPLSL